MCAGWKKTVLPTCTHIGHQHRMTYQRLYWYNVSLLMMRTVCSKHVESWNKHIEKNLCITLVVYQESLHDARSTKCKIPRFIPVILAWILQLPQFNSLSSIYRILTSLSNRGFRSQRTWCPRWPLSECQTTYGLLAGDLLGVAAHISRTPALGDSRFMCHICVYCQEVKAGRPITMDNRVTFHWCQNENVHISEHNGCDCTVRCFNGSLESFQFLLSYTARFLIENSPLVSCQDPEQNVFGLACLMVPHFDGPDRLLRIIFPCFLELGVNRHAKRWAIRLLKREGTLFQQK
jgi:hypothetical protein